MKNRDKLIVFSVAVVFALTFVIAASSGLIAKILNRTVATVNGEIILKSALDEKVEKYISELGMKKDDPKIYELKEHILNEMISEKLILQEANNEKIHVTEKEIDDGIDNLKSAYPSEIEFIKAIEDKGITLKELENEVKKQLIANKLFEAVVMKDVVQPTKKEIEEYYEENKEEIFGMLGQQIYRQKAEQHKEKWLNELKERSTIIRNEIE